MTPQDIPEDRFEARATDLIIRLTVLALLIYWSLNLVRPFLPIFIWAVVLTVALFPVFQSLSGWFGGRRGLAAFVLTLVGLLVVLGPVAALSTNLVDTVQYLSAGLRDGTLRVPAPPPATADWPLVGDKVFEAWSLASTNLDATLHKYSPVLLPAGESILHTISAIGVDVLRFVLAVVLAGFLFKPGSKLAGGGRRFAERIIAPRGATFVDLAGATIRNVSRGVVGIALLQAILAGIVLQIAGVPGAGLLAFVILVLCIIQIGPMLIILPAIVWAWMTMTTGAALAFTVVIVPIGVMDNVLKPILMGRGLSTPTLVIFLGVIGGTITYGLIGLFLGPIVLAVFYDLLVAWAHFDEPAVVIPTETRADDGQ
jgi:predicted PurR-regulated permease PerM